MGGAMDVDRMKARTKNGTATYVYGVLKSARAPSFGTKIAGLPGASPPRAVDAGSGVWIVASDAPLARYGEEAIERGLRDLAWVSACASGHEAIVERAARAGTIVPMKLFTLFASDARAIAHVAKLRKKLDRVFVRVGGCDEWGVRVLFDEGAALRASAVRARKASAKTSSGTGFLRMKKEQHDAASSAIGRAREEADAVFDALARIAKDAIVRPPVHRDIAARALLDAVFLVARSRTSAFRAAAKRATTKLGGDGFAVTLTGPWPPYHFVDGGSSP
jgi:hypothetical protein